MTADILARRYRLGALLGSGTSGAVYEAIDLVTQRVVAVKRIHCSDPTEVQRAAREAAALRALSLPGVVPLLDAGEEDGQPFLVMERVVGLPFPGEGVPAPGPVVRAVTLALLDVLDRVHRHGFVHRDVKPANVLVDADGRVWLLDFGLARADAHSSLTDPGAILGSLRYLAPELWEGTAASPASDRWAVGVMMWEALSGRPLFPDHSLPSLIQAIRSGPAWDVSAVPPEARALLMGLLERDPARRMAPRESDLSFEAPWPGPPEAVARALVVAAAGGTVHLTPGASPAALVEAVAASGRGFRLRTIPPGVAPLESLVGLGWAPLVDDVAVESSAARWVAGGLPAEDVLVMLPDSSPDPWTTALLVRLGRRVLRIQRGGPRLKHSELRALFGGPDRLLHQVEDAVEAASVRTGRDPIRLGALLSSWGRGRHAWVEDGRWLVERAWLDALAAGADGLADGVDGGVEHGLTEPERALLLLLALGRPGLSLGEVVAVSELPTWQVEAVLARLVRRGRAVRTSAGWRDIGGAALTGTLSPAALRERIAGLGTHLPPGHPARLRAALLVDAPERLVDEAVDGARRLRREGRAAAARALLEAVALVVRVAGHPVDAEALFVELAAHALAGERPADAARAASLVRAAMGESAFLAQIAALLDAAGAALRGDPAEAERVAGGIGRFADPVLESFRVALRVRLTLGAGRAAEALGELEGALRDGGADRTRLESLIGLARYRQGRFAEAARLHSRAGSRRMYPDERLSSWLNAANALLEAGDLQAAEPIAIRAVREADRSRLPGYAARAAWTLRAVRYRLGQELPPDAELLDAVARLDAPLIDGLVHLQEAAFAWRSGDPATALRLTQRAAIRCGDAGSPDGALLSRALSAACGGEEDVGALIEAARLSTLPAIAAQALTLLGGMSPSVEELLAQRMAEVPMGRRGVWLEVVRLG